MNKIQCTVGILTFNSGGTLRQTLDSVADFAEIVVCDGGSNDDTLDIAREFGCAIISQDSQYKREDGKIKDFSGVRNQMLDLASHDWFFYVDSDELVTSELVSEIAEVIVGKKSGAFWIPRKYVVEGKVIDCASTYPSKQMRLFHKDSVRKFIKTIHERIEVKEGAHIGELRNFMYIPMTTDITAIRRKWSYYLDLEEERRGSMTVLQWLNICIENAKISLLYIYRVSRNLIFCRGSKMPLYLELERHIYHLNMCRRFLKKISF